jgi:thiosulfate dehydrogenase [quinone] large subunit
MKPIRPMNQPRQPSTPRTTRPDVVGTRGAWASVSPPPRASYLAGWALLPLRAFLGFTFAFAGCQKLANPGFFDASNPASIQAQVAAAARRSPLHGVMAHLVHLAVPLGIVIAFAEVAIGLGTLLGLWTRVAAGAGLLLSFGLFLTVSFHSNPYYTGSDIVFVFAWTPLVIAGAGGVLSVDALVARHAHQREGPAAGAVVAVPFNLVQSACGVYDGGRCRAMGGAPCEPAPCPYLRGGPEGPRWAGQDTIDRRTFAGRGAVAGAAAAAAVVMGGLAAGIGRLAGTAARSGSTPDLSATGTSAAAGTGPPTTAASSGTSTTSAGGSASNPPAGTPIGPASAVPVGGAASFQDPGTGDPALVVQPEAGRFNAFDAVCPHAGCVVQFSSARDRFECPCHGSLFNARTGAVEQGPATAGLTRIAVVKGSDGQLYAT